MDDRQKIFNEIKETERKYLANLDILNKLYLKPIEKHKFIKLTPEIKNILSTLTIIHNINSTLLMNLDNANKDNVGKVFKNIIPFLKTYTSYFNSYEIATNDIRKAQKENKKFGEWLDKTEKNAKRSGQLGLNSYLIQPIQRVPRYSLLLNELLKHTKQDHEDYENLQHCLRETKKVATHLDLAIEEMDNRIKMAGIQRNLMSNDGNFSKVGIVQPHRKFLMELEAYVLPSQMGSVTQDPITFMGDPLDKADASNRFLFLFNDLLLLCKKSTKEEQRAFISLKSKRDSESNKRKSQALYRTVSTTGSELAEENASVDGNGPIGPLYVVLDQITLTQSPIVNVSSCSNFDGFPEFNKQFPNMFQVLTSEQTMTFFTKDEAKCSKWIAKFDEAMSNLMKNANYNMHDQPLCPHKGYPDEVIEFCVRSIQRYCHAFLERLARLNGEIVITPRRASISFNNVVLAMSDQIVLFEFDQQKQQWVILVRGTVLLERNAIQPGSFRFKFSDAEDSSKDREFVMTAANPVTIDEIEIFHSWSTDDHDFALQLPNLQISRKLEQLYESETRVPGDSSINAKTPSDISNREELACVDAMVVLAYDGEEWKLRAYGRVMIYKVLGDEDTLTFQFVDSKTGEKIRSVLKDGKLPIVDSIDFMHTWTAEQSLFGDGVDIALQFPGEESSKLFESLYDKIRREQPKETPNDVEAQDDTTTTDVVDEYEQATDDTYHDEEWLGRDLEEQKENIQSIQKELQEVRLTDAEEQELDTLQTTIPVEATDSEAIYSVKEQKPTQDTPLTGQVTTIVLDKTTAVAEVEVTPVPEVMTVVEKTTPAAEPVPTVEEVIAAPEMISTTEKTTSTSELVSAVEKTTPDTGVQEQPAPEIVPDTKVKDVVESKVPTTTETTPVKEKEPVPAATTIVPQLKLGKPEPKEPEKVSNAKRETEVADKIENNVLSTAATTTTINNREDRTTNAKSEDEIRIMKERRRSVMFQIENKGILPDPNTNNSIVIDESMPAWKKKILERKRLNQANNSGPSYKPNPRGQTQENTDNNVEDLEHSGYAPWQIELMKRKRTLAAKILTDIQPTSFNFSTQPVHKRASVTDLRARFEAKN
jgi:hypothetical protein